MGIEHLSEKEIKSIKDMNAVLKFQKMAVLFLIGITLLITIMPIATPLFLKRPDKLMESVKYVFTDENYYLVVGVFVVLLAFYKTTSKLMAIINKLMKSEKD